MSSEEYHHRRLHLHPRYGNRNISRHTEERGEGEGARNQVLPLLLLLQIYVVTLL